MSQIMETQMPQSCFGNDVVKTAGHILRRDQFTVIISADETFKLFIIGRTTDLFEVSFKLFFLKEHSLDVRNQRQCSSCGIGFQPCLHIELSLTVLVIIADNFTLNGDRLILEIDRIPSQTEYLAAAQTVIGGNVYRLFKPVALEYFKQRIQLVFIIKGSFIFICSRHYEFIHRVELKILHFHRIGKS